MGLLSGIKKTLFGGSSHEKNIKLQTKQQESAFKDILKRLDAKDFAKAYETMLKLPKDDIKAFSQGIESFIKPSEKQMMKTFDAGVVKPTLNLFNKQVVPGIQERFIGNNLGYSSAMNQALANAAADVSTQIGAQLPGFMQQQQANKLQALNMIPGARSNFYSPMMNALSGYGGLLSEQTFQPVISQQSGLAGPLIGAGGALGAASIMAPAMAAASSKEVKENIQDYDKGLEEIKKMEVKSYDYKDGFGDKNRIGIIAEDAPSEVRTTVEGINAVDLYGLVSLLINSVKELNNKVERLEAR